MITYKQFLIEEIKEFYEKLDNDMKQIIMLENHNRNKNPELYYNNLQLFQEGIIEPFMIKINTYDSDKLNTEFKKENIVFYYKENEVLNGYYDKSKDEIIINYSNLDSFNEIEALIGHELIHKIQHNKSGENYFKQSEREVKEINEIGLKLRELSKNLLVNRKEFHKLNKIYSDRIKHFQYLSSYEKMAYAYQYVKMFKYLKPAEILKQIAIDEMRNDQKFKKYIGMYYLIRDKI